MPKQTSSPAPEGWERVEYHEFPATIIDWDQTPDVTGKILWRETVITKGLNGEDRDSTMVAIATTDGEEVGVWGTANLDPQLAKVPDGSEVLIRFLGTESIGSGRSMRRFEVYSR